MSKNLNSTCRLCGAEYERCDNCDKLKHVLTSWKMISETEEHYKIFCVLRNYNLGKIKKEETVNQLSNYDLSDVDKWTNEANKVLVKELTKTPKLMQYKKKVEKVEEVKTIKDVNEVKNKEIEEK